MNRRPIMPAFRYSENKISHSTSKIERADLSCNIIAVANGRLENIILWQAAQNISHDDVIWEGKGRYKTLSRVSLTGFVIDVYTEVAITRLHMTSYLNRVHVERLTQVHQLHGYRVIVKCGVWEIVIQYWLICCNLTEDIVMLKYWCTSQVH